MGVTNSNKTADAAAICCGDSFKMALALTAAPDIVENPTDIVLALDCSGSMSGGQDFYRHHRRIHRRGRDR